MRLLLIRIRTTFHLLFLGSFYVEISLRTAILLTFDFLYSDSMFEHIHFYFFSTFYFLKKYTEYILLWKIMLKLVWGCFPWSSAGDLVFKFVLGRSRRTRTRRWSKERKGSRREGSLIGELGRLVPGGSSESEAGPCSLMIPKRVTCRDIGKVCLCPVSRAELNDGNAVATVSLLLPGAQRKARRVECLNVEIGAERARAITTWLRRYNPAAHWQHNTQHRACGGV